MCVSVCVCEHMHVRGYVCERVCVYVYVCMRVCARSALDARLGALGGDGWYSEPVGGREQDMGGRVL